ncbi:MAG: EamA family transporter [Bacteroidales bacterium]
MFYLVFTIITSTLIIIAFKLFPKYDINVIQAITINYLVASGFGFLSEPEPFHFHELHLQPWFPVSFLVGITLIIGFNLFALSARKTGVVITAISSRMSVVIPVGLGFLIFSEKLTTIKLIGILMALSAFYMSFLKKQSMKPDIKFIFLPFLLFLALGVNDSMMKFAQYYFIGDDFILFLSTSFFISLVLGILVLLYKSGHEKWSIKNIAAGIIIGLLNWFSTYYFLKGLDLFEVSMIVPVINVGIVALSSLAGYLFFTEKLRKINWVGILVAMISIVLMSLSG